MSSAYPSSAVRAFRPAPVILMQTTSIALPPAFMFSRRAIASPLWTRPANHVAVEPMDKHEKVLGGALRVNGEQFQRLALLWVEAMASGLNLSPLPPHLLITLFERRFRLIQG